MSKYPCNIDGFYPDGTMRPEFYISKVLNEKGSRISNRHPFVGDFMFDAMGDLIGFYMGDGHIQIIIPKEMNE